jgi:hypothetical protein
LWTNLSQNGLRFFRENYSLEAIGAKVEGLMTALQPGDSELNAAGVLRDRFANDSVSSTRLSPTANNGW